jgi:hypothetical protein
MVIKEVLVNGQRGDHVGATPLFQHIGGIAGHSVDIMLGNVGGDVDQDFAGRHLLQ